MSILKLTPSCKDYLWGGSRLRTDFGVQSDLNPLAEAWVLSCHPMAPAICRTAPCWRTTCRPPGSGGNRLQKV